MTDNTASPGQASRRATLGLLTAILLLLSWYLLADRLTPYSSQARVQAFVVPVAAEVAGQIKRVYVHDNQDVEAGAPLFEIDPEPYDIALAKARSDYQTVLSGVKANTEGVKAAEASLMAMRAAYDNAAKEKMSPKLKINWVPSTVDLSHSTLTSNANRDYVSNGYGMQRKDFSL